MMLARPGSAPPTSSTFPVTAQAATTRDIIVPTRSRNGRGSCPRDLGKGRNVALRDQLQATFGPEALVDIDGLVREQKLAALAASNHHHDRVEQDLRCDFGIAELTRALEVISRNLK